MVRMDFGRRKQPTAPQAQIDRIAAAIGPGPHSRRINLDHHLNGILRLIHNQPVNTGEITDGVETGPERR